jgi:2-iminobutanoate/2-iminopropanoate deaminase
MPRAERQKRHRVTAPGVAEPGSGLSSNCFVVNDFVIISGLTARDAQGALAAAGDPLRQAEIVFERMRRLMDAAGGTMSDIVKLNCFLTDIRHRDAFVLARRSFFSGDFPPCVVVGGVSFTEPGLLIEIDGWAILGSSD